MKSGDLVVIQIGCNEGLRAETILGSQHLRSLNAKPAKPFKILGTISANGSEEAAVLAKALQGIGDVGGTATVLLPHLRRKKCDIEHVHLVRQDMFTKTALKHHDRIECN